MAPHTTLPNYMLRSQTSMTANLSRGGPQSNLIIRIRATPEALKSLPYRVEPHSQSSSGRKAAPTKRRNATCLKIAGSLSEVHSFTGSCQLTTVKDSELWPDGEMLARLQTRTRAMAASSCWVSVDLPPRTSIPICRLTSLTSEANIYYSSRGFSRTFPSLYTGNERKSRIPVSRLAGKVARAHINSDQSSSADESDSRPPGFSRVKVELSRPLGIVLEENKVGNIVVAEIIPGGNAEKSALVDLGDQLIATSAIVYSDTDEYQGVTVRKGMQIVRLAVCGESFKTVMAAIGTHPAYIKVVLELQKCPPRTTNGASNGAAAR